MSLAVAIQMDPIESIDINGDSSFVLGLEAQASDTTQKNKIRCHLQF